MEPCAALDVSLETTAMCGVDRDGAIIFEAGVASSADAVAARYSPHAARLRRIGLEAGPLSEWLVRGLGMHRLNAILMETRHGRAALSAMIAKTDRCPPGDAQRQRCPRHGGPAADGLVPAGARQDDGRARAARAARNPLHPRPRDIDNSVRGLLRGFGPRVPRLPRGRWDAAVRELIAGHPSLPDIIEPLLKARTVPRDQLAIVDKRLRDVARRDPVRLPVRGRQSRQRLMSVPGAIVALAFRAAVDQPERFRSSRSAGACFGRTPRRHQSGESDRAGATGKAADAAVRLALFEAAHVMMTRVLAWSSLKAWARGVARRRGAKRAKVALARKLAVIMRRMWIDGTGFRFKSAPAETP
jgi:transposase